MNVRAKISRALFTGEHVMKVDTKGRVSIAADLLRTIDSELIFYKPPKSPLIVAYRSSDIVSEEATSLLSIFSKTVSPGEGGRILLQQELREHIGLDLQGKCSEVVMVGTGKNFHIMTTGTWNDLRPIYEDRLNALLAKSDILWAP